MKPSLQEATGVSLQKIRKCLAYLKKHTPEVETKLAEVDPELQTFDANESDTGGEKKDKTLSYLQDVQAEQVRWLWRRRVPLGKDGTGQRPWPWQVAYHA